MHNILAGHGPVFNPGEYVEGFTSPLWLVLLTVGDLVMPVEVAAKVLGVGLGLLTLTMVAMLGQQIQLAGGRIPAPANRNVAITASLSRFLPGSAWPTLCLNFCFIYWSVAGLDTILTTFWFTLATWSIYRFVHDGSPIVCGLLVGATPWVRPEGMVFVLLASLVVLAVGDRGPRFRRYLLCAATPVVLLLLIRWSVYGDLLPNTYYAKGRCGLSAIPMALKYLRPMAYLWALPLQVLTRVSRLGMAVRASADRRSSRPVPRDPDRSSPGASIRRRLDGVSSLCRPSISRPVAAARVGDLDHRPASRRPAGAGGVGRHLYLTSLRRHDRRGTRMVGFPPSLRQEAGGIFRGPAAIWVKPEQERCDGRSPSLDNGCATMSSRARPSRSVTWATYPTPTRMFASSISTA